MKSLNNHIENYITYCQFRKHLDLKTLKAYRIDLNQYAAFSSELPFLSKNTLDCFITTLHKQYKPKTIKRKIASLKAFFHYLEYQGILNKNPFLKLDIRFREPKLLPKSISFHTVQKFLTILYSQKEQSISDYQLRCSIRNIAVIELLFATGLRISELCSLKPSDIDLSNNTILIYGKGAKERILHLGNEGVISALNLYQKVFRKEINLCGYFFVNRLNHQLSDQSVRFMINHYAKLAGIDQHLPRTCSVTLLLL